jgi:hypothetical protein
MSHELFNSSLVLSAVLHPSVPIWATIHGTMKSATPLRGCDASGNAAPVNLKRETPLVVT